MTWLLDSTVLIDYSRSRSAAVKWLERHLEVCAISVVTLAEFRQGVRDANELELLNWFLQAVEVLPVTTDIGLQAGQWGQQYGKSHQLDMTDLLIAATAQVHGMKLATHNLKHYPMFKGLKAPYEG